MTAGTISFTRGEDPLRADKLNAGFEERALRSGDTMTGPLILSRPPAVPFEAATKNYVDGLITEQQHIATGDAPPVGGTPNKLWWDSLGCQLYIWYEDGSSAQWVPATSLSAIGSPGTFNVRDYGAKGDGTTDDTTAIQTCINVAAGAGRVYIPPSAGAYIHDTLAIPAGSHITLDGVTKLSAGLGRHIWHFDGNGSVLEGSGTIDGNASAISGGALSSGIGVSRAGLSDLVARGLHVTNVKNWPVNITGATNVLVQGCTFSNSNNSAEFAAGCTNCVFDNCTVFGCLTDHGLAIYGGCNNCAITNCVAYNNGATGIIVANDLAQSAACSGVLIADNICYGNVSGGIRVRTGTNLPGGDRNTHITITGNLCFGDNTGVFSNQGEIHVDNCSHVLIANNDVSRTIGSSVNGVRLGASTSHITVTNNRIRNIGTSGTNAAGISLSGTSDHTTISNNAVLEDRTTAVMAFAVNAENSTVGAGVVIAHNTYSGLISGSPIRVTTPSADTVIIDITDAGNINFTNPVSLASTLAVTGTATVAQSLVTGGNTAIGPESRVNGASGAFRLTAFFTAGVARWRVGANATAEGGSNAGSNFEIRRYDDAGAYLGSPLLITRSSGNAVFNGGIGVWNTGSPAAKPAVTGSRGGNVALASLLTALASYGLITDSSTA